MLPAKLLDALLVLTLVTLVALTPPPASAQSTPQSTPAPIAYDTQPLPKDPATALQLASQANGLGADSLKPWYLKAHYQTYDARGNPAAKGIFELYYAAKNRYRVNYAGEAFSETFYMTPEGEYTLGNQAPIPYAESLIWSELMHPVEILDKAPKPQRHDRKNGTLLLICL